MAKRTLKLGKSSQVHGGHYDARSKDLTLELNGATITYHKVSPQKVKEMEAAPSHGDYFHSNIRNDHEFTKQEKK